MALSKVEGRGMDKKVQPYFVYIFQFMDNSHYVDRRGGLSDFGTSKIGGER
jgi:hypothetical protein